MPPLQTTGTVTVVNNFYINKIQAFSFIVVLFEIQAYILFYFCVVCSIFLWIFDIMYCILENCKVSKVIPCIFCVLIQG